MTPWESLPNASEAAGVSSPPDAPAVSASTRWLVREHLRAHRRANGSIRGLAPHPPVGWLLFDQMASDLRYTLVVQLRPCPNQDSETLPIRIGLL